MSNRFRPRSMSSRRATTVRGGSIIGFAFGVTGLLVMAAAIEADEPFAASELALPPHLEATVWAKAPMFYNPTNIDIDERGRVWVTEGVNYRNFNAAGDGRMKHEPGDRVVILEDTDRDGQADKSSVFVQDADLVAPLGIAVFENRVLVSCSPSLIMYTDLNRDGRFDPSVDKKDLFLTGFGGFDHDHGLHSLVAGPDGRWYFNAGNAGPHIVTDKSGWTLRAGGWYTGGTPYNTSNTPGLKSDDGRIYVGGLTMAINADGTGLSVHAHNYRNNFETCLDSFGDVFQNDNDDQVVACRTTWLMQYANAGFSSADGKRGWWADRRPDQSIPTAHWHQDDPGVLPMGDLYGAGSPTGMVVYEGDALGEDYRGMLLSCEAGRNVVFGYRAVPHGAGFDLERSSFFSTGLPDDPNYKWNKVEKDRRMWFRPSDVAAGTDGAIYVSDWFDPIVGGHAMHDRIGSGTIYRIAPKDRKLATPEIDLGKVEGWVAAFKSPAPNVRYAGFTRLLAQHSESVGAVTSLLNDENPHIAARAVWLLAQLSGTGADAVAKLLDDGDPRTRILAFRALRAAGVDVVPHARRLARDASPAVRREMALAMRDVPLDACREILVSIAEGYDGKDRWYLEAFGTACEGKEEAIYPVLSAKLGDTPTKWDERFAKIAWRLHPVAAIAPLLERSLCDDLAGHQRKQAVDALAFIPDAGAANAMIEIATRGPTDVRADAAWWLGFRRTNLWHDNPAVEKFARPVESAPSEISGVRLPGGAPAYTSDIVTPGGMADIHVDVTGAQHVYLVITDAGDGNSCDWADWAEPRLVDAQGETLLTSLDWEQAKTAFGSVLVGKNCMELPLRINGRPVPDGIGAHASSIIVYDIGGRGFQWFAARGGLDNGREDLGGTDFPDSHPSVVFQVYHDGPTPEARARANETVMLDANADLSARKDAAIALARSKVGGLRLLGLASLDKIPGELRELVAEQIHLNPDLSVRALASQYFSRSTVDGQAFPAMEDLVKIPGDMARGKQLVAGKGQCATCHMFSGQGKSVGPDLTSTGRKLDRTRLFDAVLNPSASISFGYETWLIGKGDGQVMTGFIVGEGDPVVLVDAQGEQHAIPADSIEFRKRQTVSIMPELAKASLSPQELADIVEYLLSQPAP